MKTYEFKVYDDLYPSKTGKPRVGQFQLPVRYMNVMATTVEEAKQKALTRTRAVAVAVSF